MKHAPRGPIKGHLSAEPPIDGKCKAHSARTGAPCKRAPIKGGVVCATHGGSAPQVKASAQERLKALQPKAITTMDTLMGREEYPTGQFAAAKAVIDWTEGRAAEKVAVTHSGGIAISHEMPE